MRKKFLSVILFSGILLSLVLSGCSREDVPPVSVAETSDEFETAAVCVANMKLGWNLGNSLDCTGSWIDKSDPVNFETAWGNPAVTKALIHAVRQSGFHAVRVPVTYLEKMDATGKVDQAWLARVKEVVDYVLDEGMYCIINVHHDTGAGEEAWLRADSNRLRNGMGERFVSLWEQIADCFRDYGETLLFEGFNEILDQNSNWSGSDADSYDTVNQLNQLFVDTVRSSGGKNAYRNLIVSTYGASSAESQVDGFIVPTDPAQSHLIAAVHIYDPGNFCNGEDETWNGADEKALDVLFERLNEKIITAQNVPMIIGEFGSQDKFGTDEYTAERAKYAYYFVKTAKKYGMACFWWDDGGSMMIIDRHDAKPYCAAVIEAMVSAANENPNS